MTCAISFALVYPNLPASEQVGFKWLHQTPSIRRRERLCPLGDVVQDFGHPPATDPYGPNRNGGYLSVVSRIEYAITLFAHRP